MNKSRIDWPWKPLYTWNPVVGCQHNCSYCYARRMNDRFKWIDDWTDPMYFRDRILEPRDRKKPSNIFVGSMCDLFGYWVPKNWISSVILSAVYNPQHTYIFLTKNPKRYAEFEFPENCWLGSTITKKSDVSRDQHYPWTKKENRKFVSIEPLLDHFAGYTFPVADLIIVGARTGPGAVIPKREWIESIEHPNIYYKDSIRKLYPEFKNA